MPHRHTEFRGVRYRQREPWVTFISIDDYMCGGIPRGKVVQIFLRGDRPIRSGEYLNASLRDSLRQRVRVRKRASGATSSGGGENGIWSATCQALRLPGSGLRSGIPETVEVFRQRPQGKRPATASCSWKDRQRRTCYKPVAPKVV